MSIIFLIDSFFKLFDVVYLMSPNGCTLGAGKRDVDQALVVQQLAEYSQQVALMIVPP